MIEDFHAIDPYALAKKDKAELLLKEMNELTKYHRLNCPEYKKYLDSIGYCEDIHELENIPFIPIRSFKEFELKSIPDEKIFKTMMSSGTSGQRQSKIFLDKETAMLQQKVLLRILGDYLGNKRLPMLIIDSPNILKDRKLFTTRGATIMGIDFMAKKKVFALNEDMSLNPDVVTAFLGEYGKDKFVIFGFTFLVWQHLFDDIMENKYHFDMSKGYLLTAGGWKKLESLNISRGEFKNRGRSLCGINSYMDHYGMAEQTGCIYAECEHGNLHASIYSDVIIRNPRDFSVCKMGERGIIQVLSSLPRSYPGHSILTEDEGMVIGEDDCACGRKGKYIRVFGRLKNAEIRGCSDTYESKSR